MHLPPNWELREQDSTKTKAMGQALGCSQVLAQIIWNRGYQTVEAAEYYLKGALKHLADPFQMKGIIAATDRVIQAMERKERIALFGDYDVDGVVSVTIMKRILIALGHPEVNTFLPDRMKEGYGLTLAAAQRCVEESKPRLLIVLDCGTNSREEVQWLQDQGIDVVILDHHEPSHSAAPLALVNYKTDGNLDSGIGTEYCTAGLVFKFSHALIKLARKKGWSAAERVDLKDYLDLTALATIADIAPLRGENRILTQAGLARMNKTLFPGLKALMQVSGVAPKPTGTDCGFRLGPRLNAAGRLESAASALKLLLTNSDEEAQGIAMELNELNRERQLEEARVLKEARQDALLQNQDPGTRVIVVGNQGWHEGVVGIVASRICREFYLPTFVLSFHENGVGKGSGRSIEGFNLARALSETSDHLIRGGGHAMAAGVGIEKKHLEKWKDALQKHAVQSQGMKERPVKKIVADAHLSLAEIHADLMRELQWIEPCGMSNPHPQFFTTDVEVVAPPSRLGGEGKHLKLKISQDGETFDAIAFGAGSFPVARGDHIHLAYELEWNEWMGRRKIQLNVKEMAK